MNTGPIVDGHDKLSERLHSVYHNGEWKFDAGRDMYAVDNQRQDYGLSRVEILFVMAVVAILIVILSSPGFQGVADGDFQLDLKFQGDLPLGTSIRVAVGYGEDPNRYVKPDLESLLVWNDPADWDVSLLRLRCQYSYALKPDWLGRVDLSGPETFHRMLFVEYSAANKPPKYRVIPFERQRGRELVKLTVPREPPSDTEAWQPPLAE